MTKHSLLTVAIAVSFLLPGGRFLSADENQPTTRAQPTTRLAVPDPASCKAADKDIKEMFKDQYHLMTEHDRRELAKAMIKEAKQLTDDPASLYMLLCDARDAALDVGDFTLAESATKKIHDAFLVDKVDARFDMLDRASKKIYPDQAAGQFDSEPPDIRYSLPDELTRGNYQESLALGWLTFVDEALASDRMDLAQKATAQAALAATRVNDQDLQYAARLASDNITDLANQMQIIPTAKAALAKNPADPDANLILGKYLCFVKNDWDSGLPNLVQGSDPTLQALAQKDLDAQKNAADGMTAANGWWDFSAPAQDGLDAISGKQRAVHWYQQLSPTLTGLKQAMARQRMADYAAAAAVPYHNEVIDLLALVDPKTAIRKGKSWKKTPDGLASWKDHYYILVPYSPPAEYDIYFDFIRDTGSDTVYLVFPLEKGFAAWVFGDQQNTQNGITEGNNGWNVLSGNNIPIQNDTLYHTILKVRKGHITGFLNGELISDLRTDGDGMSTDDDPRMNNQPVFELRTAWASATFNSLKIVEITGQGKVITQPATQP